MRTRLRTGLTGLALAIAATAAVAVLSAALPLAARGRLGAASLVAVVAGAALLATAAGAVLLWRAIARPVDRMLRAAGSLHASSGFPVLGEGGGPALSRASVAFERVVAELGEERGRLAAKVAELERANAEVLRARESLLRAERLATLGRIASGIAHEVGNPLGAITGYVELARDRLAGERDDRGERAVAADDFLARIGAEAARIDAIVRELLDLARPAEPVLGEIDLAVPLDSALRLARVQGRFRGVEVALDVAAGLPPVVADERRLGQVFLNLLLNAGDAMAGAGRVSISARPEGREVIVRVEDSGPGIPPEDLPRVFEPFFTTKAAGQGTGLGLALSQGIVESFGGALAAANGAAGAVFTLRLRAGGGGPAGG